MKKYLFSILAVSAFFLTSCSTNKDELIIGEWHVDDVQFMTKTTDDTIKVITENLLETYAYNIKEEGELLHNDGNTNNKGSWKLDGYDFSFKYSHAIAPQKKKVKILKLDEEQMVWVEKRENKETLTYFLKRK